MLWHESLFDEPLELVVRAAAANAALICLKAAIAKVIEYNGTLDGFLKIRESAATTDAKVIQAEIEALRIDIEKTNHTYDNTLKHMDTIVIAFSNFMGEVCKGTAKDVSKIIREYFKTGGIKQPTEATSQNQKSWWAQMKRIAQAIGDKFYSLVGSREPELEPMVEDSDSIKDFEPGTNSYVVRGSEHAKEARAFVEHIRQRVLRIFLSAHRRTQRQLMEASAALSKQVWDDINTNLSGILEDAQERLKRTFDVTLDLPEPSLKISESALPEFDFDVVNQGIETYTRYIEQRGRFGKIKRWFGDLFNERWGYHKIEESREISTIDLIVLRDQAMLKLGAFEMEMRMQAETFVKSVLRKAVDDYFKSLEAYIEAFRGDLLDALDDKRLENDRLQALYSTIKKLKGEVDDLLHDGRSLAEALEAA
jgi:DNA-directed RNA polymerase subunit L